MVKLLVSPYGTKIRTIGDWNFRMEKSVAW